LTWTEHGTHVVTTEETKWTTIGRVRTGQGRCVDLYCSNDTERIAQRVTAEKRSRPLSTLWKHVPRDNLKLIHRVTGVETERPKRTRLGLVTDYCYVVIFYRTLICFILFCTNHRLCKITEICSYLSFVAIWNLTAYLACYVFVVCCFRNKWIVTIKYDV